MFHECEISARVAAKAPVPEGRTERDALVPLASAYPDPGKDDLRIATGIREYYTFRDGGDDSDRLEILETAAPFPAAKTACGSTSLMRPGWYAMFCSLVFMLAGCSDTPPPPASPTGGPPPTAAPLPENLVNVTALRSILTEVETRAAGEIRFFRMSVGQTYFSIEILDPLKPDQVDLYEQSPSSRGRLRKLPMKISATTEAALKEASIPLKEVRIEALPQLLKKLAEKGAHLEGARPPHFLIYRLPNRQPSWTLFQEGSRQNVELQATLDGKVLGFQLR